MAEKLKRLTREEFKKGLEQCNTPREMLQYILDRVPGNALDINLPFLSKGFVSSGLMKALDFFNIEFK